MDEVDKAIAVHKPDSWKGYTIGDPLNPSKFPWRLDDEKLMYPFYDKAVKAGITTICIHKGLLPPDYEKSYAGVWEYATAPGHRQGGQGLAADEVRDVPRLPAAGLRAARPGLDGVRADRPHPLGERPRRHSAEVRRRRNVYAELGTAFANSAVSHPKFCAAMVGTLVKGMGADHVLWGTDSVWYGSPQWQIEAMRRLEIPEDMRKKYGFAALGDANSMTKQMIFANNALAMYGIKLKAASNTKMPAYSEDRFAALKKEHTLAAREPLEPALRLRAGGLVC